MKKYPVLASIAVVASLSLSPALATPSNSPLDAKASVKKHRIVKAHRGYYPPPRWVEVCDCVLLPRGYVFFANDDDDDGSLPGFPKRTPWFAR